mgnify:CR=1 FL=1
MALPDEIASKTTGRRIGALPRARTMLDAGAPRPDLELLDGGGAERVGGTNRAVARPSCFSRFASLPTVVVLPVPLTPTISDDLRMVLDGDRTIDRVEDAPDLLLDQIAEARAVARAAP